MMAEVKRQRRKLKPMEEAIQFSLLQKDKNGLDGRFISDFKGRGVFSCTEFDKGDFLLEYRGDLIRKEEYERRQIIYHDALKLFMFEFRYSGKLLCVDAARDNGSSGRLVNDDHINPNSRMKTISVDGNLTYAYLPQGASVLVKRSHMITVILSGHGDARYRNLYSVNSDLLDYSKD